MLLTGTLWASAAPAADNLPRSPACRTAVQALEDAEAALADAARASPSAPAEADRQRLATARLKPLQQRVAQACLGGVTASPPPSQHTWRVPPAAPAAPPARPVTVPDRPALPPVLPALPPPRVDAPVTLTQCNAVTCTASDGSTLTRVGPTLVGPRGSCTAQGVVLRCP